MLKPIIIAGLSIKFFATILSGQVTTQASAADSIEQTTATRTSNDQQEVQTSDLSGQPTAGSSENPEIFLAAPHIVGIRFVSGHVLQGSYKPRSRDTANSNSAPKGILVGPEKNIILHFDQFIADPVQKDLINTAGRDAPSNALFDQLSEWTVGINGQGVEIQNLYRKTKIIESADLGTWPKFGFVQETVVHLELGRKVSDGDNLTIKSPTANFPIINTIIDTKNTRSDSIHVNQNGFDKDHPQKLAFFSAWLGQNTNIAENGNKDGQSAVLKHLPKFNLVRSETGEIEFSETLRVYRKREEPSNFKYNYAKADTYVADFSRFKKTGTFHVEIQGIGKSYSFEINDTVWQNAFELALRGFYHQRSGIALEKPYTDWLRPRSLHPEDGNVVYQSTTRLIDTNLGYNKSAPDVFKTLAAGKTDEIIENAWGGWHDAGDWDRHIGHLKVSDKIIELFSLNTKYFEKIELNIPESSNSLPDMLDEALWTIDLFMRLQKEDGGVPGGIEHEAHPKPGEASWTNTLDTFVFAPDPWSTFMFAGSAAQAAHVVKAYDQARSTEYLKAAQQAYSWALKNADPVHQIDKAYVDAKNHAAVQLYTVTGKDHYHQDFLTTSGFALWSGSAEQQTDAAFAYWRLDRSTTDPVVRGKIETAILQTADAYYSGWGKRGSFGEALNPWAPVGWGEAANFPSHSVEVLVRAHFMTSRLDYIKTIIDDTHFGLGANPDNISYTTGIGDEQIRELLVEDAVALGEKMPPGITAYGMQDPLRYGNGFWEGLMSISTYPESPFSWPVYETWNGFFYAIPITEYTVYTMVLPTYVWGYIAQHGNTLPTYDQGNDRKGFTGQKGDN